MDKFEMETFSQICALVDDMQRCFIDDDAYSRTPSAHEWRSATRNVHKLVLLCSELTGYASAVKMYWREDFRSQLQVLQNENSDVGTSEDNIEQGFVYFSDKEIQQMPKNFKKVLLIQKKRCRLRRRASGKETTTYEIRFRCDGYNISASGKTIEIAKAKFIEKLKTAKPIDKTSKFANVATTFTKFSLHHFETFLKEKVSQKHYENILRLFNRYLAPRFKELPLKKLTPSDCKTILDEIKTQGKGKTADDLHSVLNGIFKSAVAHGIIDRNPISLIYHTQHERKNGKALNREEERILFDSIHSDYAQAAALVLFCGLRPNELETVTVKDDFIIAKNSKRKNKSEELKRIPIIKRLRPFIPKDGVFIIPNLDMLRRHFRNVLPDHKLYDLRTTFYTRCDEYGVAPPARDEFVGHSSGILTNTYRDLSDEYLLREAEKLNNW